MASPSSLTSVYDVRFFAYASNMSPKSARVIVPIILDLLPDVASVVDFGCAHGVWLKCWMENGIEDVQGVDGEYVNSTALKIPPEKFSAKDLNDPIDLGRRFDLTYSFEVAEHLRPENSKRFVESLTRHADLVLFSAAPPGQGGESHINEQPFDIWRALFQAQGYAAYDCVRPRIAHLDEIAFWYRYNIMLYAHHSLEADLPAAIRATKIAYDRPIPDISPPLFKLRKLIINLLPSGLQNELARIKASISSRR